MTGIVPGALRKNGGYVYSRFRLDMCASVLFQDVEVLSQAQDDISVVSRAGLTTRG